MRLYFEQTSRTLDRAFGRGLTRGRVEYHVLNQEKQILYSVHMDFNKFIIYDALGNNLATIQEKFGGSDCIISGINGIQGVFERMSLQANKGYVWASAGYVLNIVDAAHYDIYKNGNYVMRINRESRVAFISDNCNYWLEVYNPECMLEGVIITMAKALLSYDK